MIDENTGLINQDTGLINDNTGLIESSTGMIEENTGLIMDTDNSGFTKTGRRSAARKEARTASPEIFHLHTLKNLPQFRNKSHQEVRQYILETKGVDIGSNFNWNKTIMWIFVAVVIVIGGIGLAKWLQQKQERKNNEYVLDTNSANY